MSAPETIVFNSATDPVTVYRYTGLNICPCGHPTMRENVPVGKLYEGWPVTLRSAKMICEGGCGRENEVMTIAARKVAGVPALGWGLLPVSGNGVTVLEGMGQWASA